MHHHAGLLIHFEAVKAKFITVEFFNVKNQAKLYFTFNTVLLDFSTVLIFQRSKLQMQLFQPIV